MNKFSGSLSLAAALLTLGGCGLDNNDDDAGRKVDEVESELVGRWLGGCEPRGPFGLFATAGEKRELSFGLVPGDAVVTGHRFEDAECKTALFRRDVAASYAVIGDAADAAGAQNLNFTVHAVKITPASDAAVAVLNEQKLCGAADWQAGVAKDVTGADCGGKSFAKGQVIFDIYDRDGDALLTGRSSFFLDGSSADARPVELDREHPLAKQ